MDIMASSYTLIILFFLSTLRVDAYKRIPEGGECPHSSGITGICSKISNCPGETPVRSAVCSYQGKIAIVCCAVGQPGLRSVEACNTLRDRLPNLDGHTNSISNGILARKKFPHMTLLGYNISDILLDEGPWKCAGSLVSEQYVLTAAHCIVTKNYGTVTKILVGAKNWRQPNGNEQEFNVDSVVIHPDYNATIWYNDIALIKLAGKVKFTDNVYPACLHTFTDEPKRLIISGWGQTNHNSQQLSDNLLEGKNELKLVNPKDCTKRYNRTGSLLRVPNGINSMMFCAVDDSSLTELSSDTCHGDSGGPIQLRHDDIDPDDAGLVMYEVVGITSGGGICGGEPPGVYTRVYYYLEWIENIIYQN